MSDIIAPLTRYNGTSEDWDGVFFPTKATITQLGNFIRLLEEGAIHLGDAVPASTDMYTLIAKIIKRVATIDTNILPSIVNGSAIISIPVDKLAGIISREHLPDDISGNTIEVATEAAKDALTKDRVHIGTFVKVTGGRLYLAVDNTIVPIRYMTISDEGGHVATSWYDIIDKPTTVTGYGITDALKASDVVDAPAAGKILKMNANGKLPGDITGDAGSLGGHNSAYYTSKAEYSALANIVGNGDSGIVKDISVLKTDIRNMDASSITTGTISLERLPKSAIPNLKRVENEAARFLLTRNIVQTGDTVQVLSNKKMYYVVDDTKLSMEAGYQAYTADEASSVPWSGVTGTPNTMAGYGIVDGVSSLLLTTEASPGNAGKILVLNKDGKLDVNITGSIEWTKIIGKPVHTVAEIDDSVVASKHANRAVLDSLSAVVGSLAYNGEALSKESRVSQVELGTLMVINTTTIPANIPSGQFILIPYVAPQ